MRTGTKSSEGHLFFEEAPARYVAEPRDVMAEPGAPVIKDLSQTVTQPTPDPLLLPRSTGGFVPGSPKLHRAYNVALAAVLLAAVLPLMAVIYVALLVTQGFPVFYRGPRLGKDGKEFGILKFRTLDSRKAAELTRDRVLPRGTGIETPLGAFLRETRLDEMPQLLNVIFGDMNICGPRPVRAEIAVASLGRIPGYTMRFNVKPGLLGPTQAYMSHGTSKLIRSRFNNAFCRSEVRYGRELALIAVVAACVVARTVSQVMERFRPGHGDLGEPAPVGRYGVRLWYTGGDGVSYPVARADEDRLIVAGVDTSGIGRLTVELPDGQRRSASIAITPASEVRPGLVRFRARGDYSRYVLDRYLFAQVVVPHRSQFLPRILARRLSRVLVLISSPALLRRSFR